MLLQSDCTTQVWWDSYKHPRLEGKDSVGFCIMIHPPGQQTLRLLDMALKKSDRELFHTESLFQMKLLSEVIHFSA